MDIFNYHRRHSSVVAIGSTPMGGEYPVRIQTMGNVSSLDTDAAVAQSIRMIEAGAEYIRFTAQGEREAQNLGEIRKRLISEGYTVPLVADIHFNPKAADVAATQVDKVRINPGNYVDKVKTFDQIEYTDDEYAHEIQKIRDRFIPFLDICKQNNTAIRIGVNHGSLSDRIMSRYGDTPEGMVASCMEFLQICKETGFNNVVISIKASNTTVMVRTVRLLVKEMNEKDMNYPLHLGVTEAGEGEDGRIKSAVGIGALLADGIGDTIRVSLSEEPEAEIPVARKLLNYIQERTHHKQIEGEVFPGFDPAINYKRKTRAVEQIGGTQPPIVISDRRDGNFAFINDVKPDFLYIGKEDPENLPDHLSLLVDAPFWKNKKNVYPFFIASEIESMKKNPSPIKFIRLTNSDLNDYVIGVLKNDPAAVILLSTHNRNGVGSQRAALHKLVAANCDVPVILHHDYKEKDNEYLQIKGSVDFGTLLLDGFGNGVMMYNENGDPNLSDNYMFGILQATRMRMSKTEYISCPGCGRTLYHLQDTIARIKEATSHLKKLKIGIMGCIVNGPGEMADADYGYVGAGRGKISLYKGKECILKNIPESEAVDKLIQLIKENGDWNN